MTASEHISYGIDAKFYVLVLLPLICLLNPPGNKNLLKRHLEKNVSYRKTYILNNFTAEKQLAWSFFCHTLQAQTFNLNLERLQWRMLSYDYEIFRKLLQKSQKNILYHFYRTPPVAASLSDQKKLVTGILLNRYFKTNFTGKHWWCILYLLRPQTITSKALPPK